MPIRFADSCSWCSATTPINTGGGNTSAVSLKYNRVSGSGTFIGGGRYGGGAYLITSTVGQLILQRVLGVGSLFLDSRNLLVANARNNSSSIWQWGYIASGMFVQVAHLVLMNTGKLRIYAGGDGGTNFGTLLYESSATLAINSWYSVDLVWEFPPSGQGAIWLYIDDVLDTSAPGMPSVPAYTPGGRPDRFRISWTNNSSTGYQISDIVVADSPPMPGYPNIGPCRVAAYVPCSDQRANWLRTYTYGTPAGDYAVVNALPGHSPASGAAPIGATSNLATSAGSLSDLFSLGRYVGATLTPGLDCYGLILALASNACAFNPGGQALPLIVVPDPTTGMIYSAEPSGPDGTPYPSTSIYAVLQSILETRPDTGAAWTDGAAANAWWGMRSGFGTPRVTQFVVEKVTTTRNVPYSCGQLGSYQY